MGWPTMSSGAMASFSDSRSSWNLNSRDTSSLPVKAVSRSTSSPSGEDTVSKRFVWVKVTIELLILNNRCGRTPGIQHSCAVVEDRSLSGLSQKGGIREGEAPAEPVVTGLTSRQELRPPTSESD